MLRNSIRKATSVRSMDEARDGGFTLIELLIVIVVLGVLAGIVTLGVTQFQATASTAACDATKDNINIAMDAWAATHNGVYSTTNADIETLLKDGATIPAGLTLHATAPRVTGNC